MLQSFKTMGSGAANWPGAPGRNLTVYLVPIHVPIYLDGERKLVTTEWHRSLELLRDSFNGRFGDIGVAAPSLPANCASAEQILVDVPKHTTGLKLFPSFDLRVRARSYWLQERKRWRSELSVLTERAAVVHSGLDDVYRPIAFEGYRIGLRVGRPTVFVQDTDIVLQHRQLCADSGPASKVKASAYGLIYERMCRWGVAHADLSLLKGSALMTRYGAYAKNAKEFHDTSFALTDIVSTTELERRLATLSEPRPLRLVYCGRLTQRKGVDRSLQILARATAMGASVEFDVIGDGAERQRLQELANLIGIGQRVQFLGSFPYDKRLLKQLSRYDGLLFTPTAEDTPRMIFDGYAAGLPIVAFDIGYVQERHTQDHAAFLMPSNRIDESAECLAQLCSNTRQLEDLSRSARSAAEYHCAENWYRRRAEWTIEAVARYIK
jgi:glycosyltransferase involved in cell wall biosynthesis